MSEYNRETSDYEPNFILKPAAPAGETSVSTEKVDPAAGSDAPQAGSTVSRDTDRMTYVFGQDFHEEVNRAAQARPADQTGVVRSEEAFRQEGSQTGSQVRRGVRPGQIIRPQDISRATTAQQPSPEEIRQAQQRQQAQSRPIYENPSYNAGIRGSYADPRANFRAGYGAAGNDGNGDADRYGYGGSFRSGDDSGRAPGAGSSAAGSNPGTGYGRSYAGFDEGSGYGQGGYSSAGSTDRSRYGESASWSNGEFRKNRKAVRDSIKKQKKASQPVTMSRRAVAGLVAGCMCISGVFGLGGAALGNTLFDQDEQPVAAQTQTAVASGSSAGAGYSLESATGSNMTVKEITAAAKNSVVEIRTESVTSDSWMQEYVTEGAGSGVIISEDGYIMTNNHVIEGASKIKVTTADEKEYEATLIGTDETNDVAVIKINASGLTKATYGNSDQLEVGDLAVAIGNPLGELGGTVTAGIISATDRALSIDGKTLHLLQTDSSINPGNSGGGLFNGDGQLVGLVVAKSAGSDVEGLGFAIPINTAANVAQQLIDKGYVSGQPSTGMTYQEAAVASSGNNPFSSFDSLFGSGSSQVQVVIYSVNGENAKNAGFQAGDVVTAVDGEEITAFEDLSAIVTSHKVGDTLKFTILRDGQEKTIKLELEEKQAGNATQQDQGSQNQGNQDQEQDARGGDNDQGGRDGFGGQDSGDRGSQDDFGSQDNGWQSWFDMFQ